VFFPGCGGGSGVNVGVRPMVLCLSDRQTCMYRERKDEDTCPMLVLDPWVYACLTDRHACIYICSRKLAVAYKLFMSYQLRMPQWCQRSACEGL
jgi:hypothetical protein